MPVIHETHTEIITAQRGIGGSDVLITTVTDIDRGSRSTRIALSGRELDLFIDKLKELRKGMAKA
jgi:hypothetical protein